jgi:thioredoxin 1
MSNNTVEITDSNFEKLVLKSEKLVIVDFWAEWCGPCKAITPILDEISNEFGDKVLIGKVNVDEVKEIPVKYGIRSIPTLLFFSNGEITRQEVGLQSKQTLVDNITQIVES